jgi:hypothetical protein
MKIQPGIRWAALAAVCMMYAWRAPAQSISRQGGGYDISTGRIAARVRAQAGRWKGVTLLDAAAGRSVNLPEVFVLKMQDGSVIESSQLAMRGGFAESGSASQAGGEAISAEFAGGGAAPRFAGTVRWRLAAKPHAGYLRQFLTISAGPSDLPIAQVLLLDFHDPGAAVDGVVKGSPVVDSSMYFGFEHPLSWAQVQGGEVTAGITRQLPLRAGQSVTYSSVAGVAAPGQMRREFLAYLEAERPRPYGPFLHYNSWFDIGYQNRYSEADAIDRVEAYGRELVSKRGVVLSSFLFDDGWDDPRTLWQFHRGFPRGFTPLAALCKEYHTRLGVWLSPFGGYGAPREERLRFGRQQGYETNAAGFALAGPKYYAAFKRSCLEMIRSYHVNHFKFDGIAAGTNATGGAEHVRDTEAMRRLMLELRAEEPDLYINLTTGSWPSPFWLRFADSLWRQGGDMGRAGKGSHQQQWLTYRDRETYRNIVKKAPLYPLSALMTQGVAYSRQGPAGDPTFNSAGFRDDVRAFFGGGTSLQELYIQPGRLTTDDWRVLAEAAKWSRESADVLVDTHWLGGDPGKNEVYGYASWSPRKGVLMLRNPADKQQQFTLDVGLAFELPAGAPRRFKLQSAWAEDRDKPALAAEAGRPSLMQLKPFEVVVLDASPLK